MSRSFFLPGSDVRLRGPRQSPASAGLVGKGGAAESASNRRKAVARGMEPAPTQWAGPFFFSAAAMSGCGAPAKAQRQRIWWGKEAQNFSIFAQFFLVICASLEYNGKYKKGIHAHIPSDEH